MGLCSSGNRAVFLEATNRLQPTGDVELIRSESGALTTIQRNWIWLGIALIGFLATLATGAASAETNESLPSVIIEVPLGKVSPTGSCHLVVLRNSVWTLSNAAPDLSSNCPFERCVFRGDSAEQVKSPAEDNRHSPFLDYAGYSDVSLRGNTSGRYPKKPLRIELQNSVGNDLKASLLGMAKDSDWILYPSYTDKTFVRDALGHELWRAMGHPAVKWRYVELFVITNTDASSTTVLQDNRAATNEESTRARAEFAGDVRQTIAGLTPGVPRLQGEAPTYLASVLSNSYHGIYVLMEKIKRGKHRLDIERLQPADDSEPRVSGGYIFKLDRVNRGEAGFFSSRGMRFAYEEPKERDITPEQRRWLTNYVNAFERVLFSQNFHDPTNGYAKYIDVRSFVDFHWLVEALNNVDGYFFSRFFHKDRGEKLRAGPFWDGDLSLGNVFYANGDQTNGWRWEKALEYHYGWYKRLFEDPDFLQCYIDRWSELRTNVLATSNVLARVDAMVAQLEGAIERNYKRWPTLGKTVHPNKFVGQTYAEELVWLKQWITGRLAWIDSQGFPGPVTLVTREPDGGTSKVSMAWLAGRLFYTTNGTDPRISGGGVSPSAREYSEPVPLPAKTQLRARVRSAYGLWSAPVVVGGD